ncbi:hypothetical protein D3C75_1198500 [compost metagenome]
MLSLHDRDDGSHPIEHTVLIDIDDPIPVIEGDLIDGKVGTYQARVVHEHINLTVLTNYLFDETFPVLQL